MRPKHGTALCVLALAACGGPEPISSEERERDVAFQISADTLDYGVKVTCPDIAVPMKGGRYRCLAEGSDRTRLRVNLVSDDRGYLKLTDKLLKSPPAASNLLGDLNKGRDVFTVLVTLDCDDLVLVKTGGRFSCEAVGNVRTTVEATFTDDRGAYRYTVRNFRLKRDR